MINPKALKANIEHELAIAQENGEDHFSCTYGLVELILSKLGKDSMHLGIIVARLTKDIHHVTYGIACIIGPFYYLDYSLVSALASLQFIARDENVVA